MASLLDQIPINVALGAAIVLVIGAFIAQTAVTGLRRELANLSNDRVDDATGLLPRGAMPTRLEPELTWARHEDVLVGLVCFDVPGAHADDAGATLRSAVRGEELAFRVSQTSFLVELWNVNEAGASIAINRLSGVMRAAGHPVIEAGFSCFPIDATDMETLLDIAQADLRPIEEREAVRLETPRYEPTRRQQMLGPFQDVAVNVLLAFAATVAMFAALTEVLAIPARTGMSLLIASVASVGVSLIASGAFVLTWNRGAGTAPRSVGPRQLGMRTVLASTCILSALIVWSLGAPLVPRQLPLFGSQLAMLGVLLVVLLQGRTLVAAHWVLLVALTVFSAELVQFTYAGHPNIANVGRVVGVMAAAPLVVKFIERLSWMFFICVMISIVDTWSVFSQSGTTHKLVESGSSALDRLLITGPQLDGGAFSMGSTDAFFICVFFCFAHRWRFAVIPTFIALWVAIAVGISFTVFTSWGVPLLPFLAPAFLIVNWRRFSDELMFTKRHGTKKPAVREATPQRPGVT